MNFFHFVDIAESYATDFRDDNFQHQVVAICIKNGRPIAFGINKKRYIRNKTVFNNACCAEIDLINKIGEKAKGSRFYLYRFNNSCHPMARQVKNGKPCIFCQHILKNAGVNKVYYINDSSELCILKNKEMFSVIGEPWNITKHYIKRNGFSGFKKISYVI